MKRQLMVVSLLMALTQMAAFFKVWFTARLFGVSSQLDGYNLALVAPTLISGVVSGFVQTGFFPVRARLHARSGGVDTGVFERGVFWGCALLGVFLSLSLFLVIPLLADILVSRDSTSVREAFVFVARSAVVLVVLNMLSDYSGYLLATRNRFEFAAAAPVLNGLIGGLMLALWKNGGLSSLILSTVVGAMLQLAICVYALQRSQFKLWGEMPIRANFLPQLREMGMLGAWVLPGVVLSNMVVSLPQVWAATFGEGAVSAFGYAYRFHASAVQLLIMTSSTLILARFSDLVAAKNHQAVRQMLRTSTMLSAGAGLLALIAVWTLGERLLLVLFGGRFDAAAAAKVVTFWVWLTAGLGFSLLGSVFAKLLQAQGRSKWMSAMSMANFLGLCASYFLLREILGAPSIAAALSIGAAATVVLGYWCLNDAF